MQRLISNALEQDFNVTPYAVRRIVRLVVANGITWAIAQETTGAFVAYCDQNYSETTGLIALAPYGDVEDAVEAARLWV